MHMYDVIIIGSGVMGMSVARALSEHSVHVAIIDRDIPGMHASYKAGGMLGAQNEFTQESALYHIARKSQQMFPTLASELLDEVALDIEYLNSGLIKINASNADAHDIQLQYQFLKQYNDQIELLTDSRLCELTNDKVMNNGKQTMYIPDDHQVNANRYTKALLESIKRRNVERCYHTEVHHIESLKQGYKVKTQNGSFYGKKVIVAGGAWSGRLVSPHLQSHNVTGVKGEALLVEHPTLNLNTTLFMTNGCYIIPKLQHRYMIGATSYFDDYSVGVSSVGRDWLLHQASTIVPQLKDSQMLHEWSGIRPYSKEECPVMDEVAQDLFVITGHYRNGILLSPYIGALMCEWLLTGQRPEDLQDFRIERSVDNAMHY